MNLKLRFALIIGVIVYFILLINLLKNNRLNLKYTLLWMFMGIVLFMLAIFPDVILFVTEIVGIIEPTNGLFAILIFCILIILVSITAIVSKLNNKNRTLIQAVAMLEKRLRDLEKKDKGENVL